MAMEQPVHQPEAHHLEAGSHAPAPAEHHAVEAQAEPAAATAQEAAPAAAHHAEPAAYQSEPVAMHAEPAVKAESAPQPAPVAQQTSRPAPAVAIDLSGSGLEMIETAPGATGAAPDLRPQEPQAPRRRQRPREIYTADEPLVQIETTHTPE
jgi:hypothetical protein